MNYTQDVTPKSAEMLRMRMQELADTMSRTSESLKRGESVELQFVADEIRAVQELMDSMSSRLKEHPLLAPAEHDAGRIEDIVDACQQIEVRQQAIDRLKRLQLVKSFDENDREAFQAMSNRVNEYMDKLTNGSGEERRATVDQVNAAESPFRAVFEMVNRPEELSDDRWIENQRLISEAFGRSVALAVLRGRAR
ncbi:hypothetical protein [Rubinisphaera margarita]|uniref:hypothetical protein n=1 Tax=Rubinisphaera margarita TaxID=2909586 RepID=UPI001EE785CE|nr:hypothetical protein [Rubinisphaera margarita]MCG6157287.1 hypothetical protein [Rubinisphaera margarita]